MEKIECDNTCQKVVKSTTSGSNSQKSKWFTGYEKQELYKIMENYKQIFNKNGVDKPCRKTKQEAWQEITKELNNICGQGRNPAQVALYYKNLRQRAKQRLERNISREYKTISHVSSGSNPDVIYVSAEPDVINLETVSSSSSADHYDIEIKKRKLELLDIEVAQKRKLMALEIECAERRKKLLDLDIAIKQKELEKKS